MTEESGREISQRDSNQCEKTDRADYPGEELAEQQKGDLPAFAVDIILDDHLKTEHAVMQCCDDKQRHGDRVDGLMQESDHEAPVRADQSERRVKKPDRQRDERHGADALPPEMAGAGMRGTQALNARKRRLGSHHRNPRRDRKNRASVATSERRTTATPLRLAVETSKPTPISQARWRMPLSR